MKTEKVTWTIAFPPKNAEKYFVGFSGPKTCNSVPPFFCFDTPGLHPQTSPSTPKPTFQSHFSREFHLNFAYNDPKGPVSLCHDVCPFLVRIVNLPTYVAKSLFVSHSNTEPKTWICLNCLTAKGVFVPPNMAKVTVTQACSGQILKKSCFFNRTDNLVQIVHRGSTRIFHHQSYSWSFTPPPLGR